MPWNVAEFMILRDLLLFAMTIRNRALFETALEMMGD